MAATPSTLAAQTVTLSQQAAGAIQNKVQQIQVTAKGLDSLPAFTLTGQALQNLQQQLNAYQAQLKQIAGTVNINAGVPTGSGTTIQEVAAVHTGLTTISPATAPSVEDVLLVFVTQDSTGGCLIAWTSLFRFAITNIDTTPSTISVFSFVGRIDPADSIVRWFMTGLPLTGQV